MPIPPQDPLDGFFAEERENIRVKRAERQAIQHENEISPTLPPEARSTPESTEPDLWLDPASVASQSANEGEPIATGCPPIDRQLRRSGLTPGTFLLIGGPSFSGKTTVGAQILLAMSASAPVFALFSDEGRRQAASRMAVMLGIPIADVDKDLAACAPRIREALGGRQVHLLKPQSPQASAKTVFDYAARTVPPGEPAVIVLDSAQTVELEPEGSSKENGDWNPRRGVVNLAKYCRAMAEQHGYIVILISQSPRNFYRAKREEENSNALAAFAEGRIENFADVAFVLYLPDKETKIVKVEFVKNRLGSYAGFDLRYDPQTGTMLEVDAAEAELEAENTSRVALAAKLHPVKERIKTVLGKNKNLTPRQIAEAAAAKYITVLTAIQELYADRQIDRVPNSGRGGGWLYSLVEYS